MKIISQIKLRYLLNLSALICMTAVIILLESFSTLAATDKTQSDILNNAADLSTKLDQYWQNAKNEVYKSVLELIAQDQSELEKNLKFSKLMHGDTTKKQIAITFDDGPHPEFTPKLLDLLDKYNIKATFFLVGEMAEKNPELVRAEVAAGHSIGNHTFHHVNLKKIPESDVATEIKACGEVLENITGKPPHLFRPPGGDYDKSVALVSEALGYKMILWTDDPGDYLNPGDKVIERKILSRIDNGGIILVHDGIQQTLDVLPRIIEHLKNEGYEFVTIDQMLINK